PGQAQYQRAHPHEGLLDTTYSLYGKPEIGPSWIRLPVRELYVMAGFPCHTKDVIYETSVIVYEEVVSSKRVISDNSTGTWVRETIIDGPFTQHDKEVLLFEPEGHSYDRPNRY